MKSTVSVFTLLLTLLFAAMSFAAEHGKSGEMKEKAAGGTRAATAGKAGTAEQLISVNQLLGNRVESPQGETLGEINNVILDPGTGRIAYVMLNTGGFFAGESKVVPFKALQMKGDRIQLNMDKEKLSDAPAWTEGSPEGEFDRKSHEFFGVGPYWVE